MFVESKLIFAVLTKHVHWCSIVLHLESKLKESLVEQELMLEFISSTLEAVSNTFPEFEYS